MIDPDQCQSSRHRPRCPAEVRPNPSLEPTRYGRHCTPGLSQLNYRLSPGLQHLPPRSGLTRTLGRTSDIRLLRRLRASDASHENRASDMLHLTQAGPLATSEDGVAKTAALRGRAQAPKLSDRSADLFSAVARLSRPAETSYSTKAQALGATAVPSTPIHRFTGLGSAGGGRCCSSQRGINRPRAAATVRPNPSFNPDPLRQAL